MKNDYPSYKKTYFQFRRNIALLPEDDRRQLEVAYRIAKKKHIGQKKFGLYPYIIHPLSVCNFIIQKLHIKDKDILLSALLHDTVEDAKLKITNIQKIFGKKTAAIVKSVSRIPKLKEDEKQKTILKTRHFKKFIVPGSYEVKILGIADKYDNIKNMHLIPPTSPHYKKRARWIKEAKKFAILAQKTNKKACWLLNKEILKAEKI